MSFVTEQLARLRAETRTEWTYGYLEGADRAPIEPESGYLSIFLRSARLMHSRRGRRRVYGTVHSRIIMTHNDSEFQAVTTPAGLKSLDNAGMNRVVQINSRLLGPTPFRGGDVIVELGLLAINSSDLLDPYLQILEELTSVAGVAIVASALPFAKPIGKGIDLLTGSAKETSLEVGLATNFNRITAGSLVVIAAPRGSLNVSDLKVDSDNRLCDSFGNLINNSHLVLEIYVDDHRSDWRLLPGIESAYNDTVAAIIGEPLDILGARLEALRRVLIMSPDLLRDDALRILCGVEEMANAARTSRNTSGAPVDLPSIEDFDPFAT